MISDSKRKALEAAGYTVKGNSVLKDGKTVAGYNSNGNLFSSAGKARDILKGAEPKVEKASPKPKGGGKITPSTKSPVSAKPRPKKRPDPANTELPRKITGGLDGNSEKAPPPAIRKGGLSDKGGSMEVSGKGLGIAAGLGAAAYAAKRAFSGAGGMSDKKPTAARPTTAKPRVAVRADTGNAAVDSKKPKPRLKVRGATGLRGGGGGAGGGLRFQTLDGRMDMIPNYAKGGMVKKKKGC